MRTPSQPKRAELILVRHSLAIHKITLMRDRSAAMTLDIARYRRLMHEVGLILCAEVTRDLDLRNFPVDVGGDRPFEGQVLSQLDSVVIPLLRAGLGFEHAFFELMPMARTGHIGLFHDQDEQGQRIGGALVHYLTSFPTTPATDFFLLDPILVTGQTMTKAVRLLRDAGVPNERIRAVTMLASRTGADDFCGNPEHAGIRLYSVMLDEQNELGQLVPGVGDPGDRMYATGDF
jgi:uracil phosphoribosyltransferase